MWGEREEGCVGHMSAQHIGQLSPVLTRGRSTRAKLFVPFPPTATCCPLQWRSVLSSNVEPCTSVFSNDPNPSHLFYWYWLFGSNLFLRSTMTASVFSSLGFMLFLNFLLLLWTTLSLSSATGSSGKRHRSPVGREAQDFLSQFLSTLNLTELRPQPRPLVAHGEPPEYMLELYNRFANDRTSANIVRSFKNEGMCLVFVNEKWKILKMLKDSDAIYQCFPKDF